MPDNVTVPTTGVGTATPVVATDNRSGVHYQFVELYSASVPQRNATSTALTISNASSISTSMVIAGWSDIHIVVPEAWTAASISFDVSACSGGTFYPLYDDAGAQVAIPVVASTAIANKAKLSMLTPWYGMRIRSGCGAASRVDQGAARTFVVVTQG